MNRSLWVFLIITAGMLLFFLFSNKNLSRDFLLTGQLPRQKTDLFKIRSIDTVKYSRDLAREKINSESFDGIIEQQVSDIAQTGATHVSIGTPYDEEFKPFLKKWVNAARRQGLNVWFRGNFSGWENWFDYQGIDRNTHIQLTEKFILDNPDLFEDGDIFTPCPECENGGPGDPRKNGDVLGHRAFLTEEYKVSQRAFAKLGKKINVGFYSMNYDVASLVMDRQTTEGLGNVVVIDHYVASPQQLKNDIKTVAQKTGGKVILGEFGAPIPDVHGSMSEQEQADWLEKTLTFLKDTPELIGVNYWVSVGGSTQLWSEDGEARKAVNVLKTFYTLKI